MANATLSDGEAPDDVATDGGTLKRRLRRSQMRAKMRALGLVAPLLLFIVITFLIPIGEMLFRSVENDIVKNTLPKTVAALETWNPQSDELPPEAAFQAMVEDLRAAFAAKTHTRVGTRLNYEYPGISSLFRKTPRRIAPRRAAALEKINAEIAEIGYKQTLLNVDSDWGDPGIWRTIKFYSGEYTSGYFLSGVDAKLDTDGGVTLKDNDDQIYLMLFQRTLTLSVFITLMTLLLGYPIAYLLATLPMRTSNILLILVLLPFWTSLLVRTSAWIVLLQQQGVVNDFLLFTGANQFFYALLSLFGAPDVASLCQNNIGQIVARGEEMLTQLTARLGEQTLSSCAQEVIAIFQAEGAQAALTRAQEIQTVGEARGYGDERFAMIFNTTGTIVAMTHILLPFMILPLYSVMKTIPPSYVRAAKSLGASNVTAFWRVYFPNTIPGIGAGAVLVFILAIGYYITPELVGGTDGVFISNRIAYHISSSLNWGLAAALGAMLLAIVLVFYFVYDRIVGIDNVKLG